MAVVTPTRSGASNLVSGRVGGMPQRSFAVSGNLAVPAPNVLAVLGLGLAGIGFARRRR